MRIVFTVALLFVSKFIFSQRKLEFEKIKQQIKTNELSIYIFCRGTKSKSALIAHEFNYSDTNITHIGIGLINKNGFTIYNVSDIPSKTNSAFRVDSLESFLNSNDVYYFSIWEYKSTKLEIKDLINFCNSFKSKKIIFDNSFLLTNGDTLYCSEFCANVLKKINNKKFELNSNRIRLNNALYEAVLQRAIFDFFPVDFFEKTQFFKKIYATKINSL